MAADTRDKRFSLIGLGSPVPSMLPDPDGTIAAADRAMLLWLYHGIAVAEEQVAAAYLLTLYARDATLTLYERSALLTLRGRGE